MHFMITMMEIFRIAREMQGMAQSEVALRADVTQSAISRFEAGSSTLSRENLFKIAPLLNINPKYITAESHNPFLSRSLIKMHFPERFGAVDFAALHLLSEANQSLEFVFLIPHFRLVSKLLAKTMIEIPCYAIAVRDGDGNIFLFRRKLKGAFIVGEKDLQSRISERMEKEGRQVLFRTVRIERELYQKIKAWDVSKKDIAGLFAETTPVLLNEEEKELIAKIREHYGSTNFKKSLLEFLKSFEEKKKGK